MIIDQQTLIKSLVLENEYRRLNEAEAYRALEEHKQLADSRRAEIKLWRNVSLGLGALAIGLAIPYFVP